jgi:hypothetical protein|nr:MAG TPA: hypothetical protein [Caudoviricetes sp.]
MAEWINDPQGREEIEKVTKELKLPVWKANHKGKFRDFWNELWDKIEDYILKLKGDTEKNSKGLNDRLISAVGKHDGDFPIANAVVGNVYYSELTKKYYKCKVAGPAPMPNGNFIDMSILENLNRLENLIKYDFVDKTQGTRYSALVFSKIGKTAHVFLDVPSSVSTTLNDGALLFTFPVGYKPKFFNLKLIVSSPSGRIARTRYDANTGNVYVLNKLDIGESMYLDTFYFLE